ASFRHFTYDKSDPMLRIWLEDVEVFLRKACTVHLKRAAKILNIDDDDWCEFEADLPAIVAHQLLHTDLNTAFHALKALVQSLPTYDAMKLVDRISPIWVQQEAARHIIPVTKLAITRDRNLVVNGKQRDTAAHYIERAFCCPITDTIISTSEISGESQQEL